MHLLFETRGHQVQVPVRSQVVTSVAIRGNPTEVRSRAAPNRALFQVPMPCGCFRCSLMNGNELVCLCRGRVDDDFGSSEFAVCNIGLNALALMLRAFVILSPGNVLSSKTQLNPGQTHGKTFVRGV